MRRGTTTTFWKKYEAMQLAMVSNCMPRTAVASRSLAVKESNSIATPTLLSHRQPVIGMISVHNPVT